MDIGIIFWGEGESCAFMGFCVDIWVNKSSEKLTLSAGMIYGVFRAVVEGNLEGLEFFL
jgi:hypothetical protein